jgi:hypothetical protein
LTNPPDLYDAGPYRASDHDPILVGIFPDADADGLTDLRDPCPESEASGTIVLGSCDSGIPNRLDETGCSLSDSFFQVFDSGLAPDERDRAIEDWIDLEIEEGRIDHDDRSALLACVAR